MFGIVNAVKFDNFFLLLNSASVFEALPQARKMRNCHRDFCFEVSKGESMDAAADDYTEKCRFMDKRVREISRFLVAPRREFAPAV